MPLVLVSTSSTIRVSPAAITFGTDHTYYYGNIPKFADSLVGRLSGATGKRIRCTTSERRTVVWIRFDHPDYGIIPPRGSPPPLPRFRAELIDAGGAIVPLQTVYASVQDLRRKFVVLGWQIAGTLDDYTGSTLRIQAPDGAEAALMKVQ